MSHRSHKSHPRCPRLGMRFAFTFPVLLACVTAFRMAIEGGVSWSMRDQTGSRPIHIQSIANQSRCPMAKYGKTAKRKVKRAMHEMKRGKLKSGRSGAKVKSRKQAIAIGLSQARKAVGKVPRLKQR